jgi:hypothetical protein
MPKRKSVGSGNTSVSSPAKQEKATTPAKKQRKVESPVTKSPAQKQQSPKGKANEVEQGKGKKNNKKADADSDDEAENLLTKSVKTSVTGQQAKKSLWEEEEQSDEGDELLQLLVRSCCSFNLNFLCLQISIFSFNRFFALRR